MKGLLSLRPTQKKKTQKSGALFEDKNVAKQKMQP